VIIRNINHSIPVGISLTNRLRPRKSVPIRVTRNRAGDPQKSETAVVILTRVVQAAKSIVALGTRSTILA
jgi:hypothetical protein